MNIHSVYLFLCLPFRLKRSARLREQFSDCVSVLDVGGTTPYWRAMPWRPPSLSLLNLKPSGEPIPGVKEIYGDGCDIDYPDQFFDLVMSNSVIEHVKEQEKFAKEMLRVGKRVYCQTPAKAFPIEPHYLGLFVHWIPQRWFTHFVHRYLTLDGWITQPTPEITAQLKQSIQLLSRRDVERLFPGCQIETERVLGWPKSYIVTRGAIADGWKVLETRKSA
jgi:SAM-dependent methyltransferase